MLPRTGRPTENPKKERVGFRLSDDEIKMLDFCCEVFGLSKTEVIRQGIKEMYEKAQKK
jgi:hypothetical protein